MVEVWMGTWGLRGFVHGVFMSLQSLKHRFMTRGCLKTKFKELFVKSRNLQIVIDFFFFYKFFKVLEKLDWDSKLYQYPSIKNVELIICKSY